MPTGPQPSGPQRGARTAWEQQVITDAQAILAYMQKHVRAHRMLEFSLANLKNTKMQTTRLGAALAYLVFVQQSVHTTATQERNTRYFLADRYNDSIGDPNAAAAADVTPEPDVAGA